MAATWDRGKIQRQWVQGLIATFTSQRQILVPLIEAAKPAAGHLGRDVGNAEPAERQPEPRRQPIRDRLDRDNEVWGGEEPVVDRSGSARPSQRGAPGVSSAPAQDSLALGSTILRTRPNLAAVSQMVLGLERGLQPRCERLHDQDRGQRLVLDVWPGGSDLGRGDRVANDRLESGDRSDGRSQQLLCPRYVPGSLDRWNVAGLHLGLAEGHHRGELRRAELDDRTSP